jgi:hypothetical protein
MMYAYMGLHDCHANETKHNDMDICFEFGDTKFIGNCGQELSWKAATVALRRRWTDNIKITLEGLRGARGSVVG